MSRSVEELQIRCRPILNQPDIILLVDKSSSPTAAHDMVLAATGDDKTAKAARWLGIIRRDYPSNYDELVKNTLSHTTDGTAMNGGKKNEKVIRD